APLFRPLCVQPLRFLSAARYEPHHRPTLRIGGVAVGVRHIANEVAFIFERSDVVQPSELHAGASLKHLPLSPAGLLLSVGAIERVEVAKELLAAGLANLPWRIRDNRIETRSRCIKHVGELEFPMEKVLPLAEVPHQVTCGLRWRRERSGARSIAE